MFISNEKLQLLRERFPVGCRIRLIKMDGEKYGPHPGDTGVVRAIDDAGTIFPSWDSGGSLGIVYGVDICCRCDDSDVTNDIV